MPDVQQAILHHGEHAEPQQVDLDQAYGIEVVFLPLDHGAPRHGGGLDGHDGAEWFFGENEPAHVNGAMTRQLVQAGDDIGQATYAFVVGIETGAGEQITTRDWLRLRPRIGRDLSLGLHVDDLRPRAVAVGVGGVWYGGWCRCCTVRQWCVDPQRLGGTPRTEPITQRCQHIPLLHREAQHARRVAHGAASAPGDLLAHHGGVFAPVAIIHVLQHALAIAVGEVDIDVGRFFASFA